MIGNDAYEQAAVLANAVAHARTMKSAFQQRGFKVVYRENAGAVPSTRRNSTARSRSLPPTTCSTSGTTAHTPRCTACYFAVARMVSDTACNALACHSALPAAASAIFCAPA